MIRPLSIAFLPLLASLALGAPAHGHENHGTESIEEIVVYGRAQQQLGFALAASEGLVGYDDLALPPMLRVGELAEAVPGMVATQHSGTGKANQYFLRGFNLDHGTDFAAKLGAVPLNMRTHGHGQGYLDLNPMIPELVRTARYHKGPYSVRSGDFSAAGSIEFSYADEIDRPLVALSGGSYGYYSALAAGSTRTAAGSFIGAIDIDRYEGPWDLDEDLEAARLHLGWRGTVADGLTARVTLQGYDADWASTDQVPQRAVRSGLIDRLGFIDGDLGGASERWTLTADLESEDWALRTYAVDSDFALWSNFTYQLGDPQNGDEFEQRDRRRSYGMALTGTLATLPLALPSRLDWGIEARLDDIDALGLYATRGRERLATIRQDEVTEWSAGAHTALTVELAEGLRAVAGLRLDQYGWDVDARLPANGGSDAEAIFSPKLTLAWQALDRLELYANWGRGFHSNDVRGTTIAIDPVSGDPADPVPVFARADGAELGARFEWDERFNASLVAFWLDLESELVFVGDAGTTEPNGATRRFGIELAGFWRITETIALDAAWTRTDASYRVDEGAGTEIPGAVESSLSVGLNAAWSNGISGSLRLRHLGEAPLVEDGSITAPTSTLVNAGIAWQTRQFELRLDALNLFDSSDNDIAYFFDSRLPGEPAAGVEDLHVHPLEPRSIRGTATWYF